MKIFLFLTFIFYSMTLIAKSNIGIDSGKYIPRFVSLKSNEANLRIGPSLDYPIVLKYIFPTMPLKVKDEFDKWRKVVDSEKNEGWIHVSLISNKRYGIIKNANKKYIEIYNKPGGYLLGHIGRGNIIKLNKCLIKWCQIKINNHKGWVMNVNIWGILENEIFD